MQPSEDVDQQIYSSLSCKTSWRLPVATLMYFTGIYKYALLKKTQCNFLQMILEFLKAFQFFFFHVERAKVESSAPINTSPKAHKISLWLNTAGPLQTRKQTAQLLHVCLIYKDHLQPEQQLARIYPQSPHDLHPAAAAARAECSQMTSLNSSNGQLQ